MTTHQIRIRQVERTDIPECRSVIEACLPEMEGLTDEQKLRISAKLIAPEFEEEITAIECLVAEFAGAVVGIGALDKQEIKRMYVHPAHRGKGVGKEIYKELESIASARGIAVLSLESSLNAEGFYENLGFKKVRKVEWQFGESKAQSVLMEKHIRTKDLKA